MNKNRNIAKREQALEGLIAGKTYSEIGDNLGISRQRVQQLVSVPDNLREQIEEHYKGLCMLCGREVKGNGHIHHIRPKIRFNSIENLELLCISCHRIVHAKPKGICSFCGKPLFGSKRKYCNKQCRYQSGAIKLICASCGREFYRLKRFTEYRYKYNYQTIRSDRYFCSKKCQGEYSGKHFGWGKLRN